MLDDRHENERIETRNPFKVIINQDVVKAE